MRIRSLTATLLLGACSLAPETQLPAGRIPAQWSTADAATTAPSAKWEDFGSAELDRLIATALAHNTDLAAALARVEQARASTRIAGSGLYPSLLASGGAGRQRSSSHGEHSTTDSANAGLSISYELDLWQRNRNLRDSADWSLVATEFDRNALALTVTSEVARLYTGVLAYDARLRVAQKNLENVREVLRITEMRYRAGSVSGLDLAQQRTSVANTEATVTSLHNQRTLFFNALALTVGTAPSALKLAQAEAFDHLTLPTVAVGEPWQLLERRPDIGAAEAELRRANIDIGVARAKALPSLSAELNASVAANPATGLVGLAGSFLAPIFQGGALEGEIDRSKAARDEQQAAYEGVLLVAFREVEDALSNYDSASARRTSLRTAADEARNADRIARAQFDAGSIDYTTFITTQNARLAAEDGYLSALQEQLAASIDLLRALGGPVTM